MVTLVIRHTEPAAFFSSVAKAIFYLSVLFAYDIWVFLHYYIENKIHREKLIYVIKKDEGNVIVLTSVKFKSRISLNFAKLKVA